MTTSRKISTAARSSEIWSISTDMDSDPEETDNTPLDQSFGKKKKRTIYTAGRPPWYDSEGQGKEAFVIGLAGGSASGKTTVAKKIIESLNVDWVGLLSMDSFYKVLTPEQHEAAARNAYDFDHPDAFDFELMATTLRNLKNGKRVDVPVYDFATHSRAKYSRTMYGANVILFEGILSLVNKELRELMDLRIFVDTDSDIRLARRLRRDIAERGRDLKGVLKQYNTYVKPAFQQYIEPSLQYAHIVVPRGGENTVAIQLIVQHVKDRLHQRGFDVRSKLLSEQASVDHDSLKILPETKQVCGMHTIIRNKDSNRDDFVFMTNRLACLVIEYSLSFLPFEDYTIDTPQGVPYNGKKFTGKLCGVTILRAGEVLEPALMSVCKDVTIGKILIQTNDQTENPELHFLRLPGDISSSHVILMDATVATGAAAIMAIRVLLDHDVPQERILFVSIIASKLGIQNVAYAFPQIKIITTALDPTVNDSYHILPGVGNYGDRYFGTGSSD
ncbi:PREDICTED: uridine-cytidine kinase-like 1 [Amphimedon queenslandica]|uniref:Uridine kinase n=1 Tax=Amphimedon queenslandica TaxID=400682 RepID=A0A1X7VS80_AMPQE|nr:PREDICTED: uridine-cytidine kinase-like 1 [Amphimedon queenslandica]|eukprot:XP_019858097.1 PREDICTED: uridine-cytidine kinase-like 1 [Amphimedon queenslandica]